MVPAASRLQLPFAEQDDDFVEFAKSLTKLPAGEALDVCGLIANTKAELGTP